MRCLIVMDLRVADGFNQNSVSETPWHSSLVHAGNLLNWLIFWFANNKTITKFENKILECRRLSHKANKLHLFRDGTQAAHVDGPTPLRFMVRIASYVALFYFTHPYVKDVSMKNNETTIFSHLWTVPKELPASSTHMRMVKSTMWLSQPWQKIKSNIKLLWESIK